MTFVSQVPGSKRSSTSDEPRRYNAQVEDSLGDEVNQWDQFVQDHGPPVSEVECVFWRFIVQMPTSTTKDIAKYNVFTYLRQYAHKEPLPSSLSSNVLSGTARKFQTDMEHESDSSLLGTQDLLGVTSEDGSDRMMSTLQKDFTPRQIRRARFKCISLLLGLLKQKYDVVDELEVDTIDAIGSTQNLFRLRYSGVDTHSGEVIEKEFDPLDMILGYPLQVWYVSTYLSLKASGSGDDRLLDLFSALARHILFLSTSVPPVMDLGLVLAKLLTAQRCCEAVQSGEVSQSDEFADKAMKDLSGLIQFGWSSVQAFKNKHLNCLLRDLSFRVIRSPECSDSSANETVDSASLEPMYPAYDVLNAGCGIQWEVDGPPNISHNAPIMNFGSFLALILSDNIDIHGTLESWVINPSQMSYSMKKYSFPLAPKYHPIESGIMILSRFNGKMRSMIQPTEKESTDYIALVWTIVSTLVPIISFMDSLNTVTVVNPIKGPGFQGAAVWNNSCTSTRYLHVVGLCKQIIVDLINSKPAFDDLLNRCLNDPTAIEFLHELLILVRDLIPKDSAQPWNCDAHVERFAERTRSPQFLDTMILILQGFAPSVHRARLDHLKDPSKISSSMLRYKALHLICQSWEMNATLFQKFLVNSSKFQSLNINNMKSRWEDRVKILEEELKNVPDYLERLMLLGIPACLFSLCTLRTPQAPFAVSDFFKCFLCVNTLQFDPLEFVALLVGSDVIEQFTERLFGRMGNELPISSVDQLSERFENVFMEPLFLMLVELAATRMQPGEDLSMDVDFMDRKRAEAEGETVLETIQKDIDDTSSLLDENPYHVFELGELYHSLVPESLSRVERSESEEELLGSFSDVTRRLKGYHSLAANQSERTWFLNVQEVLIDLIQHISRLFPLYTFQIIVQSDMPLRLLEMAITTYNTGREVHGAQKVLIIEALKIYKQTLMWFDDEGTSHYINSLGLSPLMYLLKHEYDSPISVGDGSILESMILSTLVAIFTHEGPNNANAPTLMGRPYFASDTISITVDEIDETKWSKTMASFLEVHGAEIRDVIHERSSTHIGVRLRQIMQHCQNVKLRQSDSPKKDSVVTQARDDLITPSVRYHQGRKVFTDENDWIEDEDESTHSDTSLAMLQKDLQDIAMHALTGNDSTNAAADIDKMRYNELNLPPPVHTADCDDIQDESEFLSSAKGVPSKVNVNRSVEQTLKFVISKPSIPEAVAAEFTGEPSTFPLSPIAIEESGRTSRQQPACVDNLRAAWTHFLLNPEDPSLKVDSSKRVGPESLSDSEPEPKRRRQTAPECINKAFQSMIIETNETLSDDGS
eukprot:GHVH01012112.1.p1 GENE.GHVH01012112.1~~GHVH01012112.1.p1  ORF type:complete len:1324 (-),score=199.73 GHVH01012112.1:132-4103(-)